VREEKINALLFSRDAATETWFRARFTSDLVTVVKADGSCFRGLVTGFLPAGRAVVMDGWGQPRVASLAELRERNVGAAEEGRPTAGKLAAPPTHQVLIDVRPDRSMLCACGAPRRAGQTNCRDCHRRKQAQYRDRKRDREWRTFSPLSNPMLGHPFGRPPRHAWESQYGNEP
jgi:hypothetical protein